MERAELEELHYITPISNLSSIVKNGLLSNRRVRGLVSTSIAMPEVQEIRAKKVVPGGLSLHDYVNLYVCARNPMLFKRLPERSSLCVLSLNGSVVDLPGTVVTDQNAASNYVRFGAGVSGLKLVNRDRTFAKDWTDPDQVEAWRKKSAKCAEVLVPHHVPFSFVLRTYVCSEAAGAKIKALGIEIQIAENGDLFFGYK
ncbi:DUF4433 domain-containing protein [Inquilinus sp. NPDC058860]|uniref:DUF4433 domain-containing protein n=1 Tax=Inquilinus sp. NPDC058860 TaxID=3346652 RepID=UPI0036C62151